MRGRRALTVRIVAASGVAAGLIGLVAPRASLRAQNPEPQKTATIGGTVSEAPAAKQGDSPLPLPAIPSDPSPALPAEAPKPPTSVAYTPEGALADPEAAAKAFVERSQKEADSAIGALSGEAETLRARLRKVEAGLARWQAVKDSLAATSGEGAPGRAAWHGRGANPDRRDSEVTPASAGKAGSPAPDALPDSPPRPASPDGEPEPAPDARPAPQPEPKAPAIPK